MVLVLDVHVVNSKILKQGVTFFGGFLERIRAWVRHPPRARRTVLGGRVEEDNPSTWVIAQVEGC